MTALANIVKHVVLVFLRNGRSKFMSESFDVHGNLVENQTPKQTRPFPITFICWIGFFLTTLFLLLPLISAEARHTLIVSYGLEYFIIFLVAHIAFLLSFVGIWNMRYWGLLLYTATFIFVAVYHYTLKIHSPITYIPGAIVVLVCVFYQKRLSKPYF